MNDKKKYDYLTGAHPRYIEEMYNKYKADPESVDFGWVKFFEGFDMGLRQAGPVAGSGSIFSQKEFKVVELIDAYRRRGHLFTHTNPVRERRQYSPTLAIENFGLEESDLNQVFQAGSEIGIGPATLQHIIDHLEETYCKSIGAEYRFIREPDKLKWLQEHMESTRNRPNFPMGEKLLLFEKLNQAVVFENFLHTRFVGQKRFALSGGETLIPGLDVLIRRGTNLGVREFAIGMPHRGRLNILATILHKPYEQIFSEFSGADHSSDQFAGDVKYHLGYTNIIKNKKGKRAIVSLVPNPSHLEAVSGYLQGIARSKIDTQYNNDMKSLVPILIHGDAAIAGQGVVYEVIQMSLLEGYRTGGTIHIIINNQIGFTTNYLDARSSTYCSDVAKVTLSPVFHVNADDVEAVALAARMAIEYRQEFHTDVFIDLLGYRKYGHNESDEPRFTQPTLYKAIAKHSDSRKIYFEKLLKEGVVDENEMKKRETAFRNELQEKLEDAKEVGDSNDWNPSADVCDMMQRSEDLDFESSPDTSLDKQLLFDIAERVFNIPEDIQVIDKLRHLYNSRRTSLVEKDSSDWAIGEALAYATLLHEGVSIRISGQDSKRGTFSHRHAELMVENTEDSYVPLKHVSPDQGNFEVYNSPLSEFSVLGFEFGYSSANPEELTIWEAQFGDFANEAQVVIDEYISSSEAKWGRMSGIVLLLPHGYEGQGPDHSSAKIGRFLGLVSNNNMLVVNCTTPANFFHLLRRHMKWPFRVPLIVNSPKSLLRHPRCTSPVKDFTSGGFQPVIYDTPGNPEEVRTLLYCSGKIYYELLEYQEKHNLSQFAIIRIEQLYPIPEKRLAESLILFSKSTRFFWVQEEPENMGAWGFIVRKFRTVPLGLVARKDNPSDATGFHNAHIREQQELVESAFNHRKRDYPGIVILTPSQWQLRPTSKKKSNKNE